MRFKIGDRVSFIDEPGGGIVRSVKSGQVLIETDEGFEEWVASDILIRRGDLPIKEVVQKDQKGQRQKTVLKREKSDYLEVDLHIHELVEYSKHLSNYQMLQMQLHEAEKAIAKARRAFVKKVILIHGVGEGKLRTELHQMLAGMERLNFYDADFNRYGAGATEVELY